MKIIKEIIQIYRFVRLFSLLTFTKERNTIVIKISVMDAESFAKRMSGVIL